MSAREAIINHLKGTSNPYLKQHENNPVDWYPWDEEAFEKAKRLDRPIFLSIGYSTCHWCHVMAHESFEDEDVAKAMNKTFVSVKVDREERPDIDAVHMKAAHMATGRGGWPLTVIMTPEKMPFFFATYLPKTSRSGMLGMLELCETVETMWRNKRSELLRSADDVRSMLERRRTSGGGELGEDVIEGNIRELSEAYDTVNGGFGDHPKFPSPHQLIFLLRHWCSSGERGSLDMALRTLKAMRYGGLFDHVGGGFHRYSTDSEWKLPHFEKMLYDQAMMVLAYTEAYQATRDPLFRDTVERTVGYMVRDLREDDEMFRSSEDADSEGEEGLFYLWTTGEVMKVLGKERAKAFIKAFSMEAEGNYRDEATRMRTGSNILHFRGDGDLTGFGPDLARLEAVRGHRVRPQRDDKVLLDWNALTVSALSRAGKAMGKDDTISQARRTMDALLSKMRSADGGLFHSMVDGRTSVKGFLDDHAFMLLALLDLYEACFDPNYLKVAMDVAKAMKDAFIDDKEGGFFQTSRHHERLMLREKEAYDGAMPSGNSISAMGLIRLSRMTGDHSWEELAWRTMKAFSGQLRRSPSAHTYMSCALMHSLGPSREIVVVGDKYGKDTKALLDVINSTYFPNKTVLFKSLNEEGKHLSELAPFTDDAVMVGGRATAYVCNEGACDIPTTDPEALRHALSSARGNISFK